MHQRKRRTESDLEYAEAKMEEKHEQGKKLEEVDKNFNLKGGFSRESCLVFFCIRLVVHGEHHVNYDVRDAVVCGVNRDGYDDVVLLFERKYKFCE